MKKFLLSFMLLITATITQAFTAEQIDTSTDEIVVPILDYDASTDEIVLTLNERISFERLYKSETSTIDNSVKPMLTYNRKTKQIVKWYSFYKHRKLFRLRKSKRLKLV